MNPYGVNIFSPLLKSHLGEILQLLLRQHAEFYHRIRFGLIS